MLMLTAIYLMLTDFNTEHFVSFEQLTSSVGVFARAETCHDRPLSNETSYQGPSSLRRRNLKTVSTVRPTVHTNPSRSSNWRNLKTPVFLFRVDGKHFQNGRAFRKPTMVPRRTLFDFPARVFLKHKSGDIYVFKFFRRSVNIRFRISPAQ